MEKIEWKVSYSFIKWVKFDSSALVHTIDTPQGVVQAGKETEWEEELWGVGREKLNKKKRAWAEREREADNRT